MGKFKELKNKFGIRFALYAIPIKIFKIIDDKFSKKEGKEIKNINGYLMNLDWNKKGLNRELLVNGIREKNATREFKKILEKEDIVFDLGANEGYYSLLEAQRTKKVYAVEPIEENYNCLIRNIQLNNIENINTFKVAIGEKNGESKMEISEKLNWCRINEESKNYERVRMKTFDKMVREFKNKPNVLRMDIEGYEYEILNSIKKGWEHIDKIMLEFHFPLLEEYKIKEIFDVFKKNEFKINCICWDTDTETNYKLNKLLIDFFVKKRSKEYYSNVTKHTFEDLLKSKNIMRGTYGCPNIILIKEKLK